MKIVAGWIKLHRKLLEHSFWQEKRKFSKAEAWIDLLLLANHKDNKVLFGNQMITVKRGQLVTSEIKLSKRWDWSRDRVRRFLNLLMNEGMITKESDRNKTTITIVNYEVYQDSTTTNNTTDRQPTRQPTDNQQDTNNNEKKYIVPTEQPDGASELPNKKQVIAEMVAVYRSIPGVEPRKADYSFLGQLFNEYGPGEVYGAIKALERKMESGPVSDTYSYLRATARAKAAEAAAKVTPFPRKAPPEPARPNVIDEGALEKYRAMMEKAKRKTKTGG